MSSNLLKQWQQDVEDYGDSAYLLWEIRFINSNLEFSWHTAYANFTVESACESIKRRKQSAELPFDLVGIKFKTN